MMLMQAERGSLLHEEEVKTLIAEAVEAKEAHHSCFDCQCDW